MFPISIFTNQSKFTMIIILKFKYLNQLFINCFKSFLKNSFSFKSHFNCKNMNEIVSLIIEFFLKDRILTFISEFLTAI